MRRTLLTVLVTMSALNGCSSGGDDRSDAPDPPDEAIFEDAYVDAVAATFSEGQGLSEPAAACVGQAIVGAVGVEHLNEAGTTPDELVEGEDLADLGVDVDPDAVVADITDALHACDIATELDGLVVADLGTRGSALTGPMITCIGDYAGDRLPAVIAETFVDFDPTRYRLLYLEALGACPAAFAEVVAATFHGSDGRPVTSAARACLEAHISQNPDEALRLAGNQDELATFFGDLATTCHPIFPP